MIDKKPLLSLNDIYFNLLLFLIYLFVLYVNGKTFYEIYFVDVIKEHYNDCTEKLDRLKSEVETTTDKIIEPYRIY